MNDTIILNDQNRGLLFFIHIKFSPRNIFLTLLTYKGRVLFSSGYQSSLVNKLTDKERLTFSGVKNFGFQISKFFKKFLKTIIFKKLSIKNKKIRKFIPRIVNKITYGVFFKGFGKFYYRSLSFRKAIFRGLMAQSLKVYFIKNINPVLFNGCYLPKKTGRKRRKRRVVRDFFFLKRIGVRYKLLHNNQGYLL